MAQNASVRVKCVWQWIRLSILALYVTPANGTDRDAVRRIVAEVQAVTRHTVEVAFVDQGDTDVEICTATAQH